MSLLFLLFMFVICSKEAITQKLSITRRTNDRTYTMADKGVYRFSDNEKVSMDCVLNCTACLVEKNYILNFYLHGSGHSRRVTVTANSTVKVSFTFTLHKNHTEIVCDATYLGFDDLNFSPSRSTVKLQHVSKREDNPRKGKYLEPWQESPKISPSVFKDTGAASAVFTCRALKARLALLSWHQMKGTERVLLKTVSLPNSTSETIYYSTLNKTLSESDRDTGLYCVARYFLEGPQLTDRVISRRINLTFNRIVEATFEDPHILSNTGSLALLAAIGSVAIVALILVVILVTVIVKYRRKVQEFERYEALRNRQPLPPPPSDEIYEPVYGHGAGLKRPRARPKVTRH